MRREGKEVNVQLAYIQAQRAASLHGIGVERHALFPGDLADFGDGLNGAHFVVGVHDADESSIVLDGSAHVIGINQAVLINWQVGDLEAEVLLQLLAGVAHGVVLNGRSDDVVAFSQVAPRPAHAAQGQVVALGAATGENHLFWLATQDIGHRAPGFVKGFASFLSYPIDARGVAVLGVKIGKHSLHHSGINSGGGGVVQVNRLCWFLHSLPPQSNREQRKELRNWR